MIFYFILFYFNFFFQNLAKIDDFLNLFFKLGGQNFKLDSYTDVVRPATNVSSIEMSFSWNFQVLSQFDQSGSYTKLLRWI